MVWEYILKPGKLLIGTYIAKIMWCAFASIVLGKAVSYVKECFSEVDNQFFYKKYFSYKFRGN